MIYVVDSDEVLNETVEINVDLWGEVENELIVVNGNLSYY